MIKVTLKENVAQRELLFTCNSFWQLTDLKAQTGTKLGQQSNLPFFSFTALKDCLQFVVDPKEIRIAVATASSCSY